MSVRAIIVTGASKGIGAATCACLRSRGASVLATARSVNELASLKSSLDIKYGKLAGSFSFVAGDLSNSRFSKQLVERAVQEFGAIGSIISNAGSVGSANKIANVPLEEARKMFDVNYFSVIELIQAALPHFQSGNDIAGRIVCTSTATVTSPLSGLGPYFGSKAALNALIQVLAKELPDVVSVGVDPGFVNTALTQEIVERGQQAMTQREHKLVSGVIRGGRALSPETPAESIAWMALSAPREFSGKLLQYNDANLARLMEPTASI